MKQQMCSYVLKLSGVAVLCGASAFAQSGQNGMQSPSGSQSQPSQQAPGAAGSMDNMSSMTPSGQASPADKMFVKNALAGGMAEVQAGQLAVQKGTSDDVKQFGQKMVDDHTKLGDQMKPIAQQIGVPIPSGPSKKDAAEIAKLQGLSGTAFDQAYIKAMVKDHKKDDSDFKAEAANGSDPKVKNAASQGEQVISQHLEMIQQIAQKNGAMGSGKQGQ